MTAASWARATAIWTKWGTHADLTALTHASLNELVVDAHGRAYVNGIGFDMMAGEAPGPGFVALVEPDRTARRVADGLAFPNGMAITADGGTLLVAESYGHRITAFWIAAGAPWGGRGLGRPGRGEPDGICLDADGAVWYADVPNRAARCMEGGEVTDRVQLDRGALRVHARRRRRPHALHHRGRLGRRGRHVRRPDRSAVGRRGAGPARRPPLTLAAGARGAHSPRGLPSHPWSRPAP